MIEVQNAYLPANAQNIDDIALTDSDEIIASKKFPGRPFRMQAVADGQVSPPAGTSSPSGAVSPETYVENFEKDKNVEIK